MACPKFMVLHNKSRIDVILVVGTAAHCSVWRHWAGPRPPYKGINKYKSIVFVYVIVLTKSSIRRFVITEKAPTRGYKTLC